jgi:hypothetical protein
MAHSIDFATDPGTKILEMLQFLSGGSDLFLKMLQVPMPAFEPLQFGGQSITVCGVCLSGLAQAPNLSLHVSLRG